MFGVGFIGFFFFEFMTSNENKNVTELLWNLLSWSQLSRALCHVIPCLPFKQKLIPYVEIFHKRSVKLQLLCLWCDIAKYKTYLLLFTVRESQLRSDLSYQICSHLCWVSAQIHSPVHLVIRNYSNYSCNTDAICQAVSEQRPTGESSCLRKETKQIVYNMYSTKDTVFLPLWHMKGATLMCRKLVDV